MKQSLVLLLISFLLILASIQFIYAVPILTIHSPQNITYNANKILVNVTSNEPVDFYIPTGIRIKRNLIQDRIILAENTTFFESFLYVKNGTYNYTVWANNSNGETSATVIYGSNKSNPINVTSCGTLASSDTAYVLQNDILSGGDCIYINRIRNITFDLNGYMISGNHITFNMGSSTDIEIFNGTLNSSATPVPSGLEYGPWVMALDGAKIYFHDLHIHGFLGMYILSIDRVVFKNVTSNVSIGMWPTTMTQTHFVNSSFIWNGVNSSYPSPGIIWDTSWFSELFLEEVNISGFPTYDLYLEGTFSDFYLRSTHLNFSKIKYPGWIADTRFFTQHKGVITVTDLLGQPKEAAINVSGNNLFPKKNDFDSILETLVNPTAEILTSTNASGKKELWLTEKLTYAKSSSPPTITEYDFSPYNVTVVNGDITDSSLLTLTNLNSTVPITFNLSLSTLPTCTIPQMLDLTGNGVVDISDKNLLQDYINGKTIYFNSTKQCEGLNMYTL